MDPRVAIRKRSAGSNPAAGWVHPVGAASASTAFVLPFPKRPRPPEEYVLRSGDFSVVNGQPQHPHSYHQGVPSAHRAPLFAHQAAYAPYGFAQHRNNPSMNPRWQHGDLSAPPSQHSLAPVAMSHNTHWSTATGTNPSHGGTALVRERSSLKWGVMIAITGALLGGVLGLGMDERRQSARAAAAAEARDAAPPARVATEAARPLAVPRPAALVVPVTALVPSASAVAPAVVNPPPAVLPPAAPVVAPAVVVPPTVAPKEPIVAKGAKPGRRSIVGVGVGVAAKTHQPKPTPEHKAAPEPKAAAEAPAKPTMDASTKAAQEILEQANKDSANTL